MYRIICDILRISCYIYCHFPLWKRVQCQSNFDADKIEVSIIDDTCLFTCGYHRCRRRRRDELIEWEIVFPLLSARSTASRPPTFHLGDIDRLLAEETFRGIEEAALFQRIASGRWWNSKEKYIVTNFIENQKNGKKFEMEKNSSRGRRKLVEGNSNSQFKLLNYWLLNCIALEMGESRYFDAESNQIEHHSFAWIRIEPN